MTRILLLTTEPVPLPGMPTSGAGLRARIKDPAAGWGAPPNPAGRKRDR